jgi:type IV fimbrial biogenesis protein FimT
MAIHFYRLNGFSVIELMIVVAVAAVLLATAVPSFNQTILNNRLATQVNELHTGLSLARSEAVKRNANVTVCQSSNGAGCNGSWQDGWIVFQDDNSDGNVNSGEEILRVTEAIPGAIRITFDGEQVTYASSGLAIGGVTGTFTFCDSRGDNEARGLIIGPSGRPRLAQDSDDDGTLEDAGKHELVCS